MKRMCSNLGSLAGLALGACCVVAAQPPANERTNDLALSQLPAPPVPEATREVLEHVAKWEARLAALSPGDPETYLLLGEEVLDQADQPESRRLAIELLVRAFDVARASDASSPIATSACLALVDAAATRSERQRLRSLAGALAPRSSQTASAPLHAESPEYLASAAMGLARAGYGFQSRATLRKPEALQTVRSIDGLLTRMGVPGGADAYEREARRWPCMECGNRGVTRRRDGVARECGNCGGTPGPDWTLGQTLASLRGELWLLRDEQQAWSLQSMLDDGRPAELVDPGLVARMFRVDSTRAYWRGGAWRTNPDGTDAASTTGPSPQLPAMRIDPSKREQLETPEQPAGTPPPSSPPAAPPPVPPTQLPGPLPGLNPLPMPPLPITLPRNPSTNPSEDPLPTEPK